MDLSNLNKPMLLATPSEGVDSDRTLPYQDRERPETIEVRGKTVEEEEEVDALEISEFSLSSSADLQKEMMQLQLRITVIQAALNKRNSRERYQRTLVDLTNLSFPDRKPRTTKVPPARLSHPGMIIWR